MSNLAELDTPAFVVFKDRAERNCARMQDLARRLGLSLRPHVKTHKCAEGAALQLGDQAERKIVVSTLAEAAFFADQGIEDILYAVALPPNKLPRVLALHARIARFHIMLDCIPALRALEEALSATPPSPGKPLSVFVKVDTGYHRAGIPPELGVELVKAVADSHVLTFAGLYSHDGHTYSCSLAKDIDGIASTDRQTISQFADELRQTGVDVPVVSVGSTPSCSVSSSNLRGINEFHPGNYVFYDYQQFEIGSCSLEDIACAVVARVVAHYPHRNELQVDAGALAMSKDTCKSGGFGRIMGHPDLVLYKVSQEVGIVRSLTAAPVDFSCIPIGSVLRIIPNHACLAAACFPVYHVADSAESPAVNGVWTPCKFW